MRASPLWSNPIGWPTTSLVNAPNWFSLTRVLAPKRHVAINSLRLCSARTLEVASLLPTFLYSQLNPRPSLTLAAARPRTAHENGPPTQILERVRPIADPMYRNTGDVGEREGLELTMKNIVKVHPVVLLSVYKDH